VKIANGKVTVCNDCKALIAARVDLTDHLLRDIMERGVFSDKSDGLEKAFGQDLTLDEGINASIVATVIFTMIEKAMGKTQR
jgi:hypothetical protein